MRVDRMRSRQTAAGETRKGLRVDFGAQFNTRRRTVRFVCDFPLGRAALDGFKNRARRRLLGRIYRVVFCFSLVDAERPRCEPTMTHVANVGV